MVLQRMCGGGRLAGSLIVAWTIKLSCGRAREYPGMVGLIESVGWFGGFGWVSSRK